MGLYDGNKRVNIAFKLDFDWRKFKKPLIYTGAVIAFIAVIIIAFVLLQPKPLEAELDPNPLELAKEMNSFLTVTVHNVTDATASNVVVSVETEASDAITIFPASRTITTLGSRDKRILPPFVVSPDLTTQVYSGTYLITVRTVINGQLFEKQVSLELKAV